MHTGRPDYLPDDFDWPWETSVTPTRSAGRWRRNVVCHQAALVGLGVDLADLPAYSDVNVTGTAVLLEAMGRSGVPRLVPGLVHGGLRGRRLRLPGHGRVRPAPRR